MKRLAISVSLAVVLAAGLATLNGNAAVPATPIPRRSGGSAVDSGEISILTYNVHGLPWPIALHRPAALNAIGRYLDELHRKGTAPRVAVIQEAFTTEAKEIARTSGYRYAAFGPGDADKYVSALPGRLSAASLDYGAHWWKGEGLGKWTGSGLMILSDYPIVQVRRLTYSDDACAGYDCLAAKGAMLATLILPNGRNVEIATTHLNSRHASGVDNARSNRAWLVQMAELRDFIVSRRNRALPLVLGGDLNVGSDIVRELGLADAAATMDSDARDGLRTLQERGAKLDSDTTQALDHGKDWELVLGGGGETLSPRKAWVPFGANSGSPLSDHFGYALAYAVNDRRPLAARVPSKS